MQAPPPTPAVMEVPTGMDSLMSVSELYIKQKVDLFEVITGLDVSNVYTIYRNKQDMEQKQRLMMATEKSDCCCRIWLRSRRELTMDIGEPKTTPIIKIHRPCTLCLTEMTVSDGNGREVGKLDEECSNLLFCCPVRANATDGSGNAMFAVKGPTPCWMHMCMQCPCRGAYDFEILNGEVPFGKIQNVPNGCCKMCLTNADEYSLQFPQSATAQQRAMILATVFLLDYSFFESKQDDNDN
eukprot:TRINITY_DN69301_c0_g1_i1.p1 TRINITY_DN69301_c0_g1~~TRINITY_DN69301_c0_g1_i1.p1  ORF type:complete len:254 (-),score=39.36 TRINITY_DN69301_c0_g1_i1:61-780(-)